MSRKIKNPKYDKYRNSNTRGKNKKRKMEKRTRKLAKLRAKREGK
jgi:hypothetical protein